MIAGPWLSVEDIATHNGLGKNSACRLTDRTGLRAQNLARLSKLNGSEVDEWAQPRGVGSIASRHPADDTA